MTCSDQTENHGVGSSTPSLATRNLSHLHGQLPRHERFGCKLVASVANPVSLQPLREICYLAATVMMPTQDGNSPALDTELARIAKAQTARLPLGSTPNPRSYDAEEGRSPARL